MATQVTGPGRAASRTGRNAGIVAGAAIFCLVAIPLFGRRYSFFDMKIYHGAVEWWTSGGDLYEFIAPGTTLGFTYPPFAAITMLPMAGMSAIAAGWVNVVLSIAALTAIMAVLLVPIADRCGWPRWVAVAVAVPVSLAIEPTRETLGFGQVNLVLFGLVLADLLALRWRARPPRYTASGTLASRLARFWYSGAWAGAGIGLATAVKVTPGLFIVYLMVTRQWRPAAVATGTAAGASVFAALLAPRESIAYFTSVLWQTDRVGAADFTPNQSLAGVLARLYDSQQTPTLLWITFAAVCLALGLSRAATAHAEGDELAAFTLVGLTATVVSPISWSHHLVFVVPAMLIMIDAGLRRRNLYRGGRRWRSRSGLFADGSAVTGLGYAVAAGGTYLLFLLSPIWWVRHRLPEGSHYDSGLWGVLAENSLALAVIVLVAAMPWRPGVEPATPPWTQASAARLAGLARLQTQMRTRSLPIPPPAAARSGAPARSGPAGPSLIPDGGDGSDTRPAGHSAGSNHAGTAGGSIRAAGGDR